MRLAMEKADLAGVVQRSQLVYMLVLLLLTLSRKCLLRLFLKVYYVCLVLNSNSLQDLNKMLSSTLRRNPLDYFFFF